MPFVGFLASKELYDLIMKDAKKEERSMASKVRQIVKEYYIREGRYKEDL